MLNAQVAKWQVGRTQVAEPDIADDVRRVLEALQRQSGVNPEAATERRAVEAITALALQPTLLAALQQRRDRREAIRDVATRYAFAALMEGGKALGELDALSQALVHRALDVIEKRAHQIERRRGENPLDVDPGLLLGICKSLSRYDCRKPMGGHIQWKLEHYESAVSRAMRQIKHLVTRPEVTEAFVDFVLDAAAPDVLKAQWLQLARGGGLTGVDYAETIRFFARPETAAFVKGFAATVQTARTLYAEVEYAEVVWGGKRKLSARRSQGYLETALAELERPDEVWLDGGNDGEEDEADERTGRHEVIADTEELRQREGWSNLLHREPFEVWLTRQALEARPDDVLWQAGGWLYLEGLQPEAVAAQGLADAKTVAAVQARMATLRADPDVWQTWMATML